MKKLNLQLTFTSLGGMGEIGANCYLYSLLNKDNPNLDEILIVDFGMGFNESKTSSVDTYFPNIDYLLNNVDKIKGIVITHGHEDHIGALPYLWKELKCPIYATKWTADLIYEKLKEFNLHKSAIIHIVTPNVKYNIANFTLTWAPITHSIIDNNLILLETPLGNLIHSGDFKINNTQTEIINNLALLAKTKISYLMCDSTNVLDTGATKHEKEIIPDLQSIIKAATGVCWITSFSSNLERIKNIADIAKKLKKKMVIFGRSANLYINIAIKHKYLENNVFIKPEDIKKYKRNKLIFFVTGGQGEYKSVLFNLLVEESLKEKIDPNDCIIFSSRVIPGNETKVNKLYNILSKKEIQFYTVNDYLIHVSGHPKQQDLKLLYSIIKPKYVIPIHGEHLHLKTQTAYAISLKYKSANFENGDVVELFNKTPSIIGKIFTDRVHYEGFRIIPTNNDVFKRRTKIFFEGTAFVSIVINHLQSILVNITPIGLLTTEEITIKIPHLQDKLKEYLLHLLNNNKLTDPQIQEEARIFVRRYFKDSLQKKPVVLVHLINTN